MAINMTAFSIYNWICLTELGHRQFVICVLPLFGKN